MSIISRNLEIQIREDFKDFPVSAILGPRQCGKTTLAKAIIDTIPNSIYLDLEKESDIAKLIYPEQFFNFNKDKLICLDEIQQKPEIFKFLRSYIDENRRNGQVLILGSASQELIKQSSESLAGRIAYSELTPFIISELSENANKNLINFIPDFLLRGGYPNSFLARNNEVSYRWRKNFIKTFLERDLFMLGFNIPPTTLSRLWKMLAHSHGQILNTSQLGNSLGVSHTTVRKYIDLFENTFMIRVLQPYIPNIKKRLIKSPKVYIRDTGILHALIDIESYNDLLSHPVYGSSWEGMVIENIINHMPEWNAYFYRTSIGTEIDLILTKGNYKIAVECKSSSAPKLSKGLWNALEDLKPNETRIIAPVNEMYPIKDNVFVSNLTDFINKK